MMQPRYWFVTVYCIASLLLLLLFALSVFEDTRVTQKVREENRELKEWNTEMQKRTHEVEKALDGMTRDATQFHKELEACQRAKGIEWRERMQAVCSGYTAEVQP